MVKKRIRKKKTKAPNPTKPKRMVATYGRPYQPPRPSVSLNDISMVCSNTDPFCKHADGAKQFGKGSQNTIPMQCRTYAQMPTNASGLGAMQVSPRLIQQFRGVSTYSGTSTATWNAWADAPELASLTAYEGEYRIVSAGIHVFCIAAPTDSSGVVIVNTTQEANTIMQSTSSLYLDSHRTSLAGCDLYCIAKPQNESEKFHSLDAAIQNFSTFTVMVYAGPVSKPAVGIDIFLNIEWYPILETVFARLATPNNVVSPQIDYAIINTSSLTKYVYDHLPSKEVAEKAMKFLLTAYGGTPRAGLSLANSIRMSAIKDVD
jgi:hypothetical protein